MHSRGGQSNRGASGPCEEELVPAICAAALQTGPPIPSVMFTQHPEQGGHSVWCLVAKEMEDRLKDQQQGEKGEVHRKEL